MAEKDSPLYFDVSVVPSAEQSALIIAGPYQLKILFDDLMETSEFLISAHANAKGVSMTTLEGIKIRLTPACALKVANDLRTIAGEHPVWDTGLRLFGDPRFVGET